MTYRYITIKANGEMSSEVHKKAPDWKEIQKYVEGPFQIIPYFSSLSFEGTSYRRGTAYANEEGHIRRLALNEQATRAWIMACPRGDPARMELCGPVLFVVKEKEVKDGEAS